MSQTVSVFTFSDYQLYLRERFQASENEAWGQITRAAKAAGCQRSHLSRALGGTVHLTLDQGFGLARFWELSQLETEYFLTLIEQARSASHALRAHLGTKLGALRRESENLTKRLERMSIEPGEKELAYYSAWYWSAIHILVSVPKCQTVSAIASRLQLSEPIVLSTLQALEKFGLVAYAHQKWRFASGSLHIPKGSLLIGLHHNNWRQRAVLDAQDQASEGVHYTVVQSMSRSTYEQMKQQMLAYIDEMAKLAGPSPEEELVCMTCDLFQVG